MRSLHKTILPPNYDHLASLEKVIQDHTNLQLRSTLGLAFFYMTHQHQQELLANAPLDFNECMQAVNAWIGRLNIITSALENFPTFLSETKTSTLADNVTPPCPMSRNTREIVTAPEEQEGPSNLNPISKKHCLERDQYQCMITGRKSSDGFQINVERIIPFAIANHPDCRRLDFWNMLEMFYGREATDNLFAGVLEGIDHVENLVSLDSSINTKFANGTLTLTPQTLTDYSMHPLEDHTGDYLLSVDYTRECGSLQNIESSKVLTTGEVGTLYPRCKVPITYSKEIPGHTNTFPLPSYFALRASILSLKHLCEPTPIWQYLPSPTCPSLSPSPGSSIVTTDDQSTQPAPCDATGNGPVLAASSILYELVDSGALGRSP